METNLLRRTKMTVLDEVANGLILRYTFLLRYRLHCALEDRLNQEEGGTSGDLASFLTREGIGGDRDAIVRHRRVMRGTLRLQSSG